MADTDTEAAQVEEETDKTNDEQDGHFTPERREMKMADDFVWTNEVVAQAGMESGRSFAVQGNDTSGYVGVSPEYRTYANEIDKPLQTEADHEQLRELGIHTDQQMSDARLANALAGNAPGVLMATDPTARAARAQAESDEKSEDEESADKGPEYVEEKEPAKSDSDSTGTGSLSPKL